MIEPMLNDVIELSYDKLIFHFGEINYGKNATKGIFGRFKKSD